jgi:hypothetical protein
MINKLQVVIHPVHLNLSVRISQPFSSIFLSPQINTGTRHHPANELIINFDEKKNGVGKEAQWAFVACSLSFRRPHAIASFLGEMPPNPTTAACQRRTPDAPSFLL